MARTAAARVDPKITAAQQRILRWREGGPALFAVEALGVPEKWDAKLDLILQRLPSNGNG